MKYPLTILISCLWLFPQVPVVIAQQSQLVEAEFARLLQVGELLLIYC